MRSGSLRLGPGWSRGGVDWVHLWIGLDWIGLGVMTVTPFLISNHCSTVDAVSLKL